MCGIVYAQDFKGKSVNERVFDQYTQQRNRGIQGFGLYDGKENHIVKTPSESKIVDWLIKYDSHLLLFHHRYPTSTKNTKQTAHPFSTKKHFGDNEYILVHNGHIYNAYSLKNEHEKLGIKYSGLDGDHKFNDSEALLWDFALYMEGIQDKPKAYGNIAFVCIKKYKGKLDKLYFGRNNNPLHIHLDKAGLMLSSEGKGDNIEAGKLYTFEYGTKNLTNKDLVFAVSSPSTYTQTDWDRWDKEEQEEEHEAEPAREFSFQVYEVENFVLKYLIQARGNYSQAYDRMDREWMLLVDKANSLGDRRHCELLEAGGDWLNLERAWTSEESIHPLFIQHKLLKEANDASTLRLPIEA